MPFQVVLSKRFIKDLKNISTNDRKRAFEAVERLSEEPFPPGKAFKKLKGFKDNRYRLRLGDYRIIYRVEGERIEVLTLISRGQLDNVLKQID